MARCLVLGIDGAEPSLLFIWAEAGFLPHCGALLKRAAYGPLRSTIHPLTPQAWTSMITGVNPGRHGIFDFGKRRQDGYDIELVTSRDRCSPAFWQFMPEKARAGVANVPLTWPPEPLPGFMVTGMHTPAIEQGVWPPEIVGELGDGYQIDVMAHWYEGHDRFLADLFAMLTARHRAFLRLWDHHAPDVALFVYVAVDRVQHALWSAMTPSHRQTPGRRGDLGDVIFQTYLALDKCLGDWLERLRPDDHLLLVSDHGFGDLQHDVYLNRILIDAGLLRFDPGKVRAFLPPEPPAELSREHAWVRERTPSAASWPTDDESLARGLGDPRRQSFATVDWSRTVAYSRGLCGNVWLNLSGREPKGIVTASDIPGVRRRVREALTAAIDPGDGKPLVDRVLEKEEIYHGQCLPEAPDLLVIMRDYAYTTRGATEFWGQAAVGPVVVGHTGNHRLNGVFAAAGPKIQPRRLAQADILDVLPTLFHLQGWPTPADLDGRVLSEACRPEHRQIIVGPPIPQMSRNPKQLSDEHREVIIRRLKDLGYLG